MKNNLALKTVFVILLILVHNNPVLSKTGNMEGKNIQLLNFLKSSHFNGSVLIAKKGKVVFKRAMGFGDMDNKYKLTTKSPFNLASVSKQFTAAGIMILYERRKLKLEDPVYMYLPELFYAKEIKVRHLLHHTSGLPDVYSLLESNWDKSKIAGNAELLKLLSKKKPKLLFIPGERMQYSNTGYIILASLIEKISDKSFYKFMKDNIFKPLDMKDTFAYYRTMNTYPHSERVWGMRHNKGQKILNDLIYCDGMRGDGNVHSSVEDLFKWDRALYTETLLKYDTIKLMYKPGVLNTGKLVQYGCGWGLSNNSKTVSHGGSWVGFRSLIIRYLDRQDSIIVLINYISHDARGIVEKIKKLYL